MIVRSSVRSPIRRLGCVKIALLSFIPLLNQLFPLLWINRLNNVMIRELDMASTSPASPRTIRLLEVNKKPRIVFLANHFGEAIGRWGNTATPSKTSRHVILLPPNVERQAHGGLLFRNQGPVLYKKRKRNEAVRWELPQNHEPRKYPPVKALCQGKGPDCTIPKLWLSTTNISACNTIHELDLLDHQIVAKGGKRLVWKVDLHLARNTTGPRPSKFYTTYNSTLVRERHFPKVILFRWTPPPIQETLALKMFLYRKEKPDDFGPQTIDYQHRDAVVHLVMSSSPYIVNIYGYCGASALYDYADGGNLQQNIEEKGPLQGDELLDVAHRIVASVADLHRPSRKTQQSMIAHADIYGKQWVKVRGQYQLTDFNLAKLLVRSKSDNTTFPFTRDVVDNVSVLLAFKSLRTIF
jgi:hypothetical protein